MVAPEVVLEEEVEDEPAMEAEEVEVVVEATGNQVLTSANAGTVVRKDTLSIAVPIRRKRTYLR